MAGAAGWPAGSAGLVPVLVPMCGEPWCPGDRDPHARSDHLVELKTLEERRDDSFNLTTVTQFILMGLSDLHEVRYPLFAVFATVYQITMVGNGAILLAVGTEKKLHTPMYYLLANLSLLDIFCSSVTVPKMLENLLTEKHSISFVGCALQLYFLVALMGTEVFLLAVMAYDRYVAICFPLRYTLIMTKVCCVQLTSGTWVAGFLNSLIHTLSTFSLSFCKSNRVNQYYCDIPQVVALSCSSTYLAEMLALVIGGIFGISACLATFISYIYIISTILKIQSAEGKRKAFSTCASHLLVVCLFYGTAIFTYMRPSSSQRSPARDRIISMLYGVLTPMLNPIIYSLRNTEVKGALRRVLCR
ncbi:olfactory receptor 5V1-like [Eulemur rufifrons]|uniref:olfactory receptor 5V1-like n=1 Tax=Eulemur rufifrons TaxID=859984 RepID=UPI0037422559